MAEHTAPVSVREHRFGSGPPFTVGIEEEYMLLDAASFDLVPAAERILATEAGGEFAANVASELFASVVEYHTAVCTDMAEAGRELRRLRRHAVAAAAAHAVRLGSAGTHPFARFEHQPIMHRDRYEALIEQLQYAGRRELIYGLHVHVAVDDADRAIRIVNALRAHLSELVALSANSPFWRGEPTGYASCRHLIFSAFPRSGPPPHFRDYEEYADTVQALVAAGCLEDYTRIWWDLRPHPRFGTVEVRVMDAVTRLDHAIALAAYVQALVRRYCEDDNTCHPMIANENKWRAARYGLAATVVDPVVGGAIPIRALIERTLAAVAPYAAPEIEGVRAILCDGNGADYQRRIGADPRALTRAIADATSLTPARGAR